MSTFFLKPNILDNPNTTHRLRADCLQTLTSCGQAWPKPPAWRESRVSQEGRRGRCRAGKKTYRRPCRLCCENKTKQLLHDCVKKLGGKKALRVIQWAHMDSSPSISSKLWIRPMATSYISFEMWGSSPWGESTCWTQRNCRTSVWLGLKKKVTPRKFSAVVSPWAETAGGRPCKIRRCGERIRPPRTHRPGTFCPGSLCWSNLQTACSRWSLTWGWSDGLLSYFWFFLFKKRKEMLSCCKRRTW